MSGTGLSYRLMSSFGAAAIALVLAAPVEAALLSGSVSNPTGVVNLTTQGTFDWSIYNYADGATAAQGGTPTSRKSGGSGIGNATAVGGGLLRSVTGLLDVTFTDGTPTASASVTDVRGLANDGLDLNGRGVAITITGDPAAVRTAYVYVSGYEGTGDFTASLNGATAYTNSVTYSATKTTALYTLTFQPNSSILADQLTISYTMSGQTSTTNSHVGLYSVALAPEPGAAAVLLAGTGLLAMRRRRVAALPTA